MSRRACTVVHDRTLDDGTLVAAAARQVPKTAVETLP